MSAKFVWGVVAIVVGVAGVFAGIDQIAEVVQLDSVVNDFARQFGAQKYMGEYSRATHNAKLGGLIKIVGGLCLSVFGTWLIQEARYEDRAECRRYPEPDEDRWRGPMVAPPFTVSSPRGAGGNDGPKAVRRGAAAENFDFPPRPGTEGAAAPASGEVCPDCGARMVVRKVSKGPHIGRHFWACTKYPQCRSVKPVSAELSAQMEF